MRGLLLITLILFVSALCHQAVAEVMGGVPLPRPNPRYSEVVNPQTGEFFTAQYMRNFYARFDDAFAPEQLSYAHVDPIYALPPRERGDSFWGADDPSISLDPEDAARKAVRIVVRGNSLTVTSPQGTKTFGVSQGRPGFQTARGCYQPYRWHRHYNSRKYNNAPMPFSVFFHEGQALHWGDPGVASHGCVHIPPSEAANIYNLIVHKYGAENTSICIE